MRDNKGWDFLTAFEDIDEKYIYQAAKPWKENKIVRVKHYIRVAAACIILVAAIGGQELAQASNYSLSRFKAKFKEELGITPAEYITLQKMDRAQMLLKTTDDSITDIAYQLGFSSSNYFCSVFKKTLSYSPAAYRKSFSQS